MFQDGSYEIIWPPATLVQCVHSSSQQHASVQAHCVQSTMIENKLGRERLSLHTISYNTSQNQLPSCRIYNSVPIAVDAHYWEMLQFGSEDKQRRSIRIRTMHVIKQNCLTLSNALLIPCASLWIVSRTISFLFIFPSERLFPIGLVPIFSFKRSLPPILVSISKQPTHRKCCVAGAQWAAYRIVTLSDASFPAT